MQAEKQPPIELAPATTFAPHQGVATPIERSPPQAPPATKHECDHDSYLIAFASPDDPLNPLNWSSSRKWLVTDVLSATGFNRIMVSTIMAPALPLIASELSMSTTEAVMSMSIYLLATAFGPLFIGPLSEMYGRGPVLHASNVWFLIWNIACGFATTKELLISARFLAGFGASSIYALAGGVLGDLWRPEQRGKSLAWYLLIPLLAVAVGPIIGGFMAYRTTWRWMFWATSAFQAVMVLMSFVCFHETYAPVILQRRARNLRRLTGDPRYQTVFERLDMNKSLASRLGRALTRPLRQLAFHPIIQVTSIFSAFSYGLLYIMLSSLAEIWAGQYQQSVEMSGLHYMAVAAGEILGSLIGGKVLDSLYPIMKAKFSKPRITSTTEAGVTDLSNHQTDDTHVPELRVPLILPGLALAPFGFFLYGWGAHYHLHWAIVDLGVLIASFGMQIAGIPQQAYVMDAYSEHASSALAANQFLRSLTAFLFPLFVPQMYATLGYGWGNSLLGFMGFFVGLPMVWILWRYGAKLRSKTTMDY